MSHPPIPKCKWFVKTDGGTWALTYRDATGCIDDFINIEPIEELGWIPDASIRYFAACVAECEWRKRADRYSKVAAHFQSLFTGATRADRKTTRMKAIYQMAACRRTAEEWRAWGESK